MSRAGFEALGAVAEFINGAAFKPEDWGSEGSRIIRIQNLTDPSRAYNRTRRIVPERLRVHPGELLVSWSATLGVFEWVGPDIGLLNQHIFRVVPNTERVDKRYLFHLLSSAISSMHQHMHGATMQHINRDAFLSTRVFLPRMDEQRRIAAILDKADELRAKRRAAIAQLDTLAQSIFLEMFGDPATNPKGWPRSPIGDAVLQITDGEHLNPAFSTAGMPIVMAGDVREDGVQLGTAKMVDAALGTKFRQKCAPEIGDLLLVSRGATIGRQCVIRMNSPFCLMGSVILIKPQVDKLNVEFLSALLKLPALQSALFKTSGSSAQQAIYLKDLRNLDCPIPSIHLQREFAAKLASLDELRCCCRISLTTCDTLFACLQHRAFRGEL